MMKMIEADKAMRIVREECLEFMSNSEIFTQTDLMLFSLNKAINTRIKALPYTDAEPVVRCKDCKYLFSDSGCPLRTWRTHVETDYCSYGEPKE